LRSTFIDINGCGSWFIIWSNKFFSPISCNRSGKYLAKKLKWDFTFPNIEDGMNKLLVNVRFTFGNETIMKWSRGQIWRLLLIIANYKIRSISSDKSSRQWINIMHLCLSAVITLLSLPDGTDNSKYWSSIYVCE